jgi:hypothetical protein
MATAAEGDYQPAYPLEHPGDAKLRDFIKNFYRVSDTAGSVDEWLEFFADDATLVMGLDKAVGKPGEKRSSGLEHESLVSTWVY